MKNIMWLASYPKSGNTWLRIFLTSYLLDKKVYINNLYGTPMTGARKLFEFYSNKDTYEISDDEIDNLRPEVWRRFSEDVGEDLILVKAHDCCHPNKNGELIFPFDVTKGVIHIVRNPLDVAVSYAFHNDVDMETITNVICNNNHAMASPRDAKQLRQIVMSWEQHAFSWQSQSLSIPILELRYEDMTLNPKETFTKVIDFCGLPLDEEKLERSINSSRMSRLVAQEERYGFKEKGEKTKKFFRKGVIGDWRNHLSEKQKNTIIKCSKEAMKLYGYLDDKDEPMF